MNDFPLFKISSVASTLAAGFAFVSLIATVVFMFLARGRVLSIKLLGSLMVLALAFASNNGAVYFLAIFIVATLVTDLDFLEKIAALFWNRDKYWEYRMKQETPSEALERVENEAKEEAQAEAVPEAASSEPDQGATVAGIEQEKEGEEGAERSRVNTFVAAALNFRHAVQRALDGAGSPFSLATLRPNCKLVSLVGEINVDAIVETPTTDYVIEIKYSKRPHALLNAFTHLERSTRAYRAYLSERGISRKNVVPVAVLPASANVPAMFKDAMPVLLFDGKEQKFTNREAFLEALQALQR